MPKLHRPDPADIGPKYTESRDAIADLWGERTPFEGAGSWPVRVDEQFCDTPDRFVQSACISCSIGCGVDIGVKGEGKDAKIVGVRGRASDRVNKGRLGPKGLYTWQSMYSKDRLTTPLIRNKEGVLEKATWEEAMSLIVSQTKDVQKRLTSHGLAFYTSGQLFLEEYLTLAVIGKAGLGTLHMDGNTRLCTATAAASMRESFGADGQPSSYTDIDMCDALFICGHNPGATGTVLWMRMLDRLKHKNPPKLVVMDPRTTSVGKEATVHLKPRIGTNLAVLNGLAHLIIKNNWHDEKYIEKSVYDFENLKQTLEEYTPEHVEKLSGVPVQDLMTAATILGKSERLLATALQGIYQSNQATASACAINNIVLMRGMIGKPGGGVFQMNGQPTAQNNRETGCDGEYPCFRNFQNMDHMQSLADAWNIDIGKLPHHSQPTNINDLLNYMEDGSVEMLWISGTNPAVSLPQLERVRKILTQPNLFVVAQDIFPNETTALADVVLPAAGWGEKTGCYTNVDRTVHLSDKAVEPPGECRSDLDIWVDYATRMNFTGKDGSPLVYWKTPEETFEVWRRMSKDTLCDYSGLNYGKLRAGNGMQWPCNELTSPKGTERLYTNGVFPTFTHNIQTWTSDLETGTALSLQEFKAMNPNGRAIFKACHFHPSDEMPTEEYPFNLSTGRRVYHFHTRTKTSRSKKLHEAMPDTFLQISEEDAKRLGIEEGEHVVVRSKHGEAQMPAKIGDIEVGQVFVPFHFGTADAEEIQGRARAANELTRSGWDPISKQPYFKGGAVSVEKCEQGVVHIHEKQSSAIAKAEERASGEHIKAIESEGRERHLEDFIGLWNAATDAWRSAAEKIVEKHKKTNEYEIRTGLGILLRLEKDARDSMLKLTDKYGDNEKEAMHSDVHAIRDAVFPEHRRGKTGVFNIILDLQGLHILVVAIRSYLTPVTAAATALHDTEFGKAVKHADSQYARIEAWIVAQIKVRGPQNLIVPALTASGEL